MSGIARLEVCAQVQISRAPRPRAKETAQNRGETRQQTFRVCVSGYVVEFPHAAREIEAQNDGILPICTCHARRRVKNKSVLCQRRNALEEGCRIQRFKRHVLDLHVVCDLFVRAISNRSHRALSKTRIFAGSRSSEDRIGSERCDRSTNSPTRRSLPSSLALMTSMCCQS